MSRLKEYFKNRKRPFYWFAFVFGLLWMGLAILQMTVADNEVGAFYLIMASAYLVMAFIGKPEEPPADPRPMDEKLREAFADLTPEELQSIIDDDLRSEETKAVARELLKR